MSIKGQGHSLTLVKGHSDFKVKCLTFGLYTQVSDSGPLGPLVSVSDPDGVYFQFFGTDGPAYYSIMKYTFKGGAYRWQQVGVFKGK